MQPNVFYALLERAQEVDVVAERAGALCVGQSALVQYNTLCMAVPQVC